VAGTLIQSNPDRLSNTALIASGPNKDIAEQIEIKSYPNILQEEAQLVEFLAKEFETRKSLSHCAVIYRKHAQVNDIVQVLEKRGLPLNIVNRVNALKLPLIKNLCNILSYLEGELSAKGQNNRQLFEIMHYDFFGIRSTDISKIMTQIYRDFRGEDTENIGLDEAIVSADYLAKIDLNDPKAILRFGDLLAKWIGDIHNVTLQTLFQRILNEGGVLQTVLQSSEKTWLMQVLTTIFNLIKNESDKNPDFSIADFNLMITQMVDNKISLPVTKVVSAACGVHFLTAHRAKGLEYENVFIIGATEDKWNGRSYNKSFAYPDTVNRDSDTNDEDERRLMYVAMTRAEKRLQLSFSRQKEDGKEIGPTKFVDEIANHEAVSMIEAGVTNAALNDYQYHRLLLSTKTPELLDHDLIDRVLANFSLSVTALNKYLKCPISFYFDTILQVPTARSKYMGFGRAVHFALENIYKKYNAKEVVDVDILINYFNKGMLDHKSHFTPKELKDMTAYGKQILPMYFEKYMGYDDQVLSYEVEYRIDNVQFKGVPIKGLIDRVDIFKDRVEVVDYKTGNPANKRAELKAINLADAEDKGGDYWRQIVFYKILLMQDTKLQKEMTKGIMEFVEPDKNTGEFTIKDYNINPDEIEAVGSQIVDAWTKIHNHEFSKGCGDENCNWCEFVKNDYVFTDQVVFDADDEMWIEDPEIA
jgi:DNA helicase-2/ATP-dependent DNA helicase PcrA